MNVSIIRLLLLLGIFVTPPLCYAQSQPGGAQESGDQRLLAGLRQRRLFNLAALYCQRHLADPELTAQRRATLAIEMIKTLADRALHASPADRQAHWKEADQGVAAFNEQLRESPRHVLIQIQGALLWRTRGEALLHEAQMLDSAAADLQRARGYLRQASTQLAAAQQVIARLLRTAGRNNAAETLATTELMTLERNVSFQLACCYRATALCYPKQSDDWLNALSLARERLEPLAELSVAEETIWQARVERIRCLRLLGEAAQAHAAVDKLMKNNPPAQVKLAARSEQIRLALAEKNVTAALALAKQPRSEQGVGWPELDLAHLEAILTALRTAQQSGDTADRDRWQQQAASQVALIEREDGPYWMRRAETLLAAEVAGSAGGDVSAMQRAAESFFRGGRFEEALRAFDQASANAIERGNAAKAFELAFVAATIEHENQRHAEAAHRYLTLARMLPKNQRAAEAHLLAIVNWAQVVRDLPAEQRGAAIGQYDQLLREHLERWPEQESAHQASIWLGDLLRARREWQAAIDLFQKVPAQSKHYQEGARGAAECFVRLIEQLKAAGEPFEPTAAAAVAYLDDIVLGRERKWPQQFNRLQQDAALASAKIRLGHSQGTVADAGRLLQEAIARSPDATEAWRDEARILSVYALAADARRAEAAAALDAVASGSTELLLSMLDSLASLPAADDPHIRSELAELALGISTRLQTQRGKLTPAQARDLDRLTADALAALGKRDKALEILNRLAKENPRDGRIEQQRLNLLSQTEDRATLETALAAWRVMEKKSRRGSERWFAARYATAESLFRLGRSAEAATLIQLTRVLEPSLGGDLLRAKFERLLAEAQE